jgi:hypothetical protein
MVVYLAGVQLLTAMVKIWCTKPTHWDSQTLFSQFSLRGAVSQTIPRQVPRRVYGMGSNFLSGIYPPANIL